jgi:acetyl-CoA carboxylase carboxyltransferase component
VQRPGWHGYRHGLAFSGIAVMGAEGAANIIFRKENDESER